MKISKEITDSLTLKFAELARKKNREGDKIISLGLGEPIFKTPESIIVETINAIKSGHTRYSNPRGLLELRESLVNKFKTDNDITVNEENIIVTPGAKQAMMLALMAILEPGDEVINFMPCYVSYVPQIKIAEPLATIHNIDVNKKDFSIDWDLFSKTINNKTKAIIINSPNNPTGKMFTKDDMFELVKRIEKYDCYVLSDEIYEKLVFSDLEHISPGSISSIKDRVITINGFSKAFAMTGWRIGFLSSPQNIIHKILKLQQHINTNTVTFIQKGLLKAYELNNHQLSIFIKSLNEKSIYMKNKFLNETKLNYVAPEGGIFSFININKSGLDSDSFATQLLDEYNVAVTPGIGFGMNWDDHIRVSMVIDNNEFFKGIDTINTFISNRK